MEVNFPQKVLPKTKEYIFINSILLLLLLLMIYLKKATIGFDLNRVATGAPAI